MTRENIKKRMEDFEFEMQEFHRYTPYPSPTSLFLLDRCTT